MPVGTNQQRQPAGYRQVALPVAYPQERLRGGGGSRWYTQPKGCIPDDAVAQ